MEINHISMPEGSGSRNMQFGSHISIENMTKVKRGIVKIDNAHHRMCLARSFVVGICQVNRKHDAAWEKRWNLMRQSKRFVQNKKLWNCRRNGCAGFCDSHHSRYICIHRVVLWYNDNKNIKES